MRTNRRELGVFRHAKLVPSKIKLRRLDLFAIPRTVQKSARSALSSLTMQETKTMSLEILAKTRHTAQDAPQIANANRTQRACMKEIFGHATHQARTPVVRDSIAYSFIWKD
jgi:hypothetical protein